MSSPDRQLKRQSFDLRLQRHGPDRSAASAVPGFELRQPGRGRDATFAKTGDPESSARNSPVCHWRVSIQSASRTSARSARSKFTRSRPPFEAVPQRDRRVEALEQRRFHVDTVNRSAIGFSPDEGIRAVDVREIRGDRDAAKRARADGSGKERGVGGRVDLRRLDRPELAQARTSRPPRRPDRSTAKARGRSAGSRAAKPAAARTRAGRNGSSCRRSHPSPGGLRSIRREADRTSRPRLAQPRSAPCTASGRRPAAARDRTPVRANCRPPGRGSWSAVKAGSAPPRTGANRPICSSARIFSRTRAIPWSQSSTGSSDCFVSRNTGTALRSALPVGVRRSPPSDSGARVNWGTSSRRAEHGGRRRLQGSRSSRPETPTGHAPRAPRPAAATR